MARSPTEISLLDILLTVDGDEPMFRCGEIRQNGPCGAKPEDCKTPCNIAFGFARAQTAYRESLANVDLATLASDVATQLGAEKIAQAGEWMGENLRPES